MQAGQQDAEQPTTNGLTSEQLSVLRQMLESKRDELRRKHERHIRAARRGSDERSESMDIANQAASEAELLAIAERERAVLLEIDQALDRIRRGTYGLSEATGAPISFNRLLTVPWARNDAQEQDLLDRR